MSVVVFDTLVAMKSVVDSDTCKALCHLLCTAGMLLLLLLSRTQCFPCT